MVGIIQHEGEGAHLKITGTAVVLFNVPHKGRNGLPVLASGDEPLEEAIPHGVSAGAKAGGIQIDFGVFLCNARDAGDGVGILQHLCNDWCRFFLEVFQCVHLRVGAV